MEPFTKEEKALIDDSINKPITGEEVRRREIWFWVMVAALSTILFPVLYDLCTGAITFSEFGKTAGFVIVMFAMFLLSRRQTHDRFHAQSTIAKLHTALQGATASENAPAQQPQPNTPPPGKREAGAV